MKERVIVHVRGSDCVRESERVIVREIEREKRETVRANEKKKHEGERDRERERESVCMCAR